MGDVKEKDEGMFDEIGDSISDMFSGTSDAITDNKIVKDTGAVINNTAASVKNALSSVSIQDTKDALMDTLSDSTSVLFLIIILLVISLIIGYIIYYIITDTVLYQTKVLVTGTDVPLFCNKISKLPIQQKLDSGNGQKRAYAFWLYIFNAPDQSSIRHIAHISKTNDDDNITKVDKASPYIILNANNGYNNIGVRIPYNNVSTIFNQTNHNNITQLKIDCSYFEFKYVPVQRWVHIAFVISDIAGGSVTTYVDGNLNEVLTKSNRNDKGHSIDFDKLHDLSMNHEGVLCVGGKTIGSGDGPDGFEGLFSKFTMWNYDINKNDVYKDYRAGPLNGILASLGIGAYGLRNPIYKLDAAHVEDDS